MFGVVQFLENGRLQVLTVPMSWVKGGFLMWPKSIGNDKIERMRKDGTSFHGATKAIPVMVTKKFRNLAPAEAAVEELARKDVSDFEGKKKVLAKKKKKKPATKLDELNELCAALVQKKQLNAGQMLSSTPPQTLPSSLPRTLTQQKLPLVPPQILRSPVPETISSLSMPQILSVGSLSPEQKPYDEQPSTSFGHQNVRPGAPPFMVEINAALLNSGISSPSDHGNAQTSLDVVGEIVPKIGPGELLISNNDQGKYKR
ncbi:uncharacterized protein LOC134209494 [Armigeres subalbatus]|uniref:uncharacterized protein LOC134209494 n=1 Tax=Armigeres subalbatus TaxID=124917 RepID=UPI002ED5AA65